MKGVPARSVLREQVRPAQLGQPRPYEGGRLPDQTGRRGRRDVRAGMQAQYAEQAGGLRSKRAVGPGEDCPRIGGRITGGERVKAGRRLAKIRRNDAEGWMAPAAGQRGDNGEREGQPRAAGNDLGRRLWFGIDSIGAEPCGQQPTCLVGGQTGRASGRGRPQRLLTRASLLRRCDQCQPRRARQKGANLVGIAGVVEQHQHPLASQQ